MYVYNKKKTIYCHLVPSGLDYYFAVEWHLIHLQLVKVCKKIQRGLLST